MAKKFQQHAIVDHDDSKPCRKKGLGRSCMS